MPVCGGIAGSEGLTGTPLADRLLGLSSNVSEG